VRRALRLLNGFKIGPNELLLKVDSKTQAYLDDFIKRKKEMLVAAKSVTLTPANLAEVDIKLGDTEEQFEKDEAEEDENLKSQLLAYYDENLVATGCVCVCGWVGGWVGGGVYWGVSGWVGYEYVCVCVCVCQCVSV